MKCTLHLDEIKNDGYQNENKGREYGWIAKEWKTKKPFRF